MKRREKGVVFFEFQIGRNEEKNDHPTRNESKHGNIVRELLANLEIGLESFAANFKLPPAKSDSLDWVHFKVELNDHSKVASSSPHSPEQVRVIVLVSSEQLSLTSDNFHSQKVVNRKSVFP